LNQLREKLNTSKPTLIQDKLSATIDLRSLIDEIPMGVVLLDVDRRIVWMNRALEALTGFSQEEAAGIPCYHILRHRVCLKDCPALHMQVESESESLQSDLINRDRMKVPVSINLAPLKDKAGNLAGFLETVEDLRSIRELGANIFHAYSFADLVGRSPQMEKIFQILPVLAQNDSSILITGETGTGKDRVAEAIHQASGRAKGPYVKVNCGALPETLLESELFGHQKGAFTGAVESKPGRFRTAHRGTLYLTEIGDLPLSLQVKLLTFLDDQVVYPLGSTKGFQANVRVVAATHRNLEQMVRDGGFREDLLFRLNVVRIHIPPLREREGDVRLLLDHFLNSLNSRLGKSIAGFSKKALDILKGYPYPGNVRELQNIIEYAVNICQERQILPDHLPAYLTEAPSWSDKIVSTAEQRPSLKLTGAGSPKSVETEQTWNNMERRMIMEALVKAGGNRSKAAEIMGWGRSTLWRKMKQYGI
jgi:two-component system, NtrC family, response regulator AtoC